MEKDKKNLPPGYFAAFDKALLSWIAPEYPHQEKSWLWFAVASVVLALLVLYGLFTDGWTFSMAVLVFAGTYYLLHRETSPLVEVKISRVGIKIGIHIFSYSQIRGFWILYDPAYVRRLYVRMQSRFRPDVFVDLGATDPAELREILAKHIKELKGLDEPFGDLVVRLLRL